MGRRQQTLRDSPVVRFGTAGDFFQKLESEKDALPVYRGELYLEKHQGTYTTQAKNKRFNRQCEFGLQNLEELCVRAANLGDPYPAEILEGLWKRVLLLQFHDILPGSSIQRVYTEARAEYDQITEALRKERDQALEALRTAGEGWSAYNPTSFDRKVFVKHQGRWLTGTIPAHGADVLKPCAEAVQQSADCLDNGLVRVVFSPDGNIRHFIDLKTGFDYAGAFLNRLTLYEDPFLPYNAWDIDWEYHQKPFQVLTAQSMEFCTDGPALLEPAPCNRPAGSGGGSRRSRVYLCAAAPRGRLRCADRNPERIPEPAAGYHIGQSILAERGKNHLFQRDCGDHQGSRGWDRPCPAAL